MDASIQSVKEELRNLPKLKYDFQPIEGIDGTYCDLNSSISLVLQDMKWKVLNGDEIEEHGNFIALEKSIIMQHPLGEVSYKMNMRRLDNRGNIIQIGFPEELLSRDNCKRKK